MFGTNIKVDFSSAWKKLREEVSKVENVELEEDKSNKLDYNENDGGEYNV